MELFDGPEPIVENNDVLKPNNYVYQPETLPERYEEISEIERALRPIQTNDAPDNILVYGPTGQGKTVAVNMVMSALEKKSKELDHNVAIANVKCKGCNKSYNVLSRLVKELREIQNGPGEDRPKGLTKKDLVQIAFDEIDNIGGTVIIVLDEIDDLGDDLYAIYELSRPDLNNAKIGLIGITNDTQFKSRFQSDVNSSFGEREVIFGSYNASHLQDILSRRVVKALVDTRFIGGEKSFQNLESDVIQKSAIAHTAKFEAKDTGDARHAIRLLRYACEEAEEDGRVVRPKHIKRAREKRERDTTRKMIVSETMQRQLVLCSVAKESIKNNNNTTTGDVYTVYQTLCNEFIDNEPLSKRSVRNKLNDLTHSNILNKKTKGRGRGKGVSNYYTLSVDEELAIDSIDEAGMLNDVVKFLRGQM